MRCTSLLSRTSRSWLPSAGRRQLHSFIDIHPEVQEALNAKKPVVALESALITHGFEKSAAPRLGLSLENIVRSTGSIPATIAIMDGRIKVGLEKSQLEELASKPAAKISRRDIGPALALKANGGTTICSTSIFSSIVGIRVFATGGLGGVHRGGENSLDISADLHELSRCPVAVVSAGAKSILDIGRTLEYLETLGVPVIAFSKTRDFPAFFGPRSGFQVPWNSDDPKTIASMLDAQWQIGLTNGALVAAPIPEKYEAQAASIQAFVDQAVAESEANGVSKLGKDATPWLLKRVAELTEGKSLESNVALLENTALIGGQIAVHYHALRETFKSINNNIPGTPQLKPQESSVYAVPELTSSSNSLRRHRTTADLAVVGSAAVDLTARPTASIGLKHSTVPGTVTLSLGGVGRNIAEAAHRVLGSTGQNTEAALVAPQVDDAFGRWLVLETDRLGMRTDGFVRCAKESDRTAVCNMVLDGDGGLVGGVADMNVVEEMPRNTVLSMLTRLQPKLICIDGNLSVPLMTDVLQSFRQRSKLFFEPTSVTKSSRVLQALASISLSEHESAPIHFASPNLIELKQMYQSANELDLLSSQRWWSIIDSLKLGADFRVASERLARQPTGNAESESKETLEYLLREGAFTMAVQLLPYINSLCVKLGPHGVLLVQRTSRESSWAQREPSRSSRMVTTKSDGGVVIMQHFPALPVQGIVNVTGAGDSFVGCLLASLVSEPELFEDPAKTAMAITLAQKAAVLTLHSVDAVSKRLSESDWL